MGTNETTYKHKPLICPGCDGEVSRTSHERWRGGTWHAMCRDLATAEEEAQKLTAMRAAFGQMKEALTKARRFAFHSSRCPAHEPGVFDGCTCGYDDAEEEIDAALDAARKVGASSGAAVETECVPCLGYGHFNANGTPSMDGRDRKCLHCSGVGRVARKVEVDRG